MLVNLGVTLAEPRLHKALSRCKLKSMRIIAAFLHDLKEDVATPPTLIP